MKPYSNIKLTEFPDIADIRSEGRKSSVGRLDRKNYTRKPKFKAAVRRTLKRRNKSLREKEENE